MGQNSNLLGAKMFYNFPKVAVFPDKFKCRLGSDTPDWFEVITSEQDT